MAGVLSKFAQEIIAKQWLFSNGYSMVWEMPTINTFRLSSEDFDANPEIDINPIIDYSNITDATTIDDSCYFSFNYKNTTNSPIQIKQIALYNTISNYEMNENRGGPYFRPDHSDVNQREWYTLYNYNLRRVHGADSEYQFSISAGPLNDLVVSKAYYMCSDSSNITTFAQAQSKIYIMYDFAVPTKINEIKLFQDDNDWNISGARLYGTTQNMPAWNSLTAWSLIDTVGSFVFQKGKNKYIRFNSENRYRCFKVEFDIPVSQTAFTIKTLNMYFSKLVAKIPVGFTLQPNTSIEDRVYIKIGV